MKTRPILLAAAAALAASFLPACRDLRASLQLGDLDVLQAVLGEVEPNNTAAMATPILPGRYRANAVPADDLDLYSFAAVAGDLVSAAVMTSASANSTDSTLELLAPDGVTVVEVDQDDGSLSNQSSSIAGAAITADGTYFLRVKQNGASGQLRPYDLYLKVDNGTPTSEVEPNDTPATATPLGAGRWGAGTFASPTDVDFFTLDLNAGDTVFLSLDLDPERDGDAAGQAFLGPFGAANTNLLVNDIGAAAPDSEALFMTVNKAGTYTVAAGANGAALGAYRISVLVIPAPSQDGCTTYTSADVPVVIPTGPAIVVSTLTPDSMARVGSVTVQLKLNHTNMADLDVQLTTPQGNVVGLLSDIGGAAFPTMDMALSDEAGAPPAFQVLEGLQLRPELAYRLEWMRGAPVGGTWTLTLRDDAALNGGTLEAWSITVCPLPDPLALDCGAGVDPVTRLAATFEAGDSGFTHAGTLDAWAVGTPVSAPLVDCSSGTACFKTNLAGAYQPNSNQTLFSPSVSLAGLRAPIRAVWSQRFQLESASFDTFTVDARVPNTAVMGTPFYVWNGATMTDNVGNPTVTLNESTAWDTRAGDLSAFAGSDVQLAFNLTTDGTVQLSGVAVDDVYVLGCPLAVCGDNTVTPPEACDDGNLTDGDGCDSNCKPTSCGNGILTMGETCDDGNQVNGDGCDANCTVTACGNGIMTGGEACDDGNAVEGDGCDSNCTVSACGNSVPGGAETCDDGNPVDGDGCDSNCTLTACGNGVVTLGELCDDGNQVNGDGCDNNCTVTACGNGAVSPGEACDDGNPDNGDGCDVNCTPTSCGNGIMTGTEACDDANAVEGDGCDSNCTISACGNGIPSGAEMCDDANAVDGDGCDSNCTITACGNGITTALEVCDDGNAVDGDGCDTNCTVSACGNGIKTGTEACDDGNNVEGDGCDTNCTVSACGNGIKTGMEMCDDANPVDGDGCDTNCTITACGNGIKTGTEACDDGNNVEGDGCDSNCKATGCGNGILTAGEACDDGNMIPGDGCSAACTVELPPASSSSSAASLSSSAGSSGALSSSGQATSTATSAQAPSSSGDTSSAGNGSSAQPPASSSSGSSSMGQTSSSGVATSTAGRSSSGAAVSMGGSSAATSSTGDGSDQPPAATGCGCQTSNQDLSGVAGMALLGVMGVWRSRKRSTRA